MLIEKGHFKSYRSNYYSLSETFHFDCKDTKRINVFISHSHDDLEQIQDILAFLSLEYGVNPYIDSQDDSMPAVTSRKTAERIKKKIVESDKFILLATEGAISSKWCNWELGFGDCVKLSSGSIALFPMKDVNERDSDYKGNEYLDLYPYVVYEDGTRKYTKTQKTIEKGYYIRKKKDDGTGELTPLKDWLERGINK